MKGVILRLAERLDDEFDVGSGLCGTIAWYRSFLGTGA